MSRSDVGWKQLFGAAILDRDVHRVVAIMDSLKTDHAGTPRQAVKDAAARLVEHTFAPDPDRVYEIGMAFVTTGNAATKEIGIALLPPFYAAHEAEVNEQFLRVGDDANWEVREWAASALAYVVVAHFDLVHSRLREWSNHPSPNVRRLVVVAAGYATRDCTSIQCKHLLDVLTPLMADTNAYVSKNLGAFALGSYAVRYQHELVAEWATGLDLDNEQIAWSLAMIFTTAEGAKHLDALQELFLSLVRDDRKKVQRAVKKALSNLEKRAPGKLDEVLQGTESSQR